ncbi:MAG: translocation/assembly module TamB domain-containing protein [Halioglobus sp.]|nr:translocation/assembly module TamB domain-containing protein [Halioglobus sp.]
MSLADLAVAGLELNSALFSAAGDAATRRASLRSRGDIDGVLEVSGRAGVKGMWSGELAATTLQTPQGSLYLGEPVALEFSPSPARLRLAAHCWQLGQSRLCPGEALLGAAGRASLALQGDMSPFAAYLPQYLQLKGRLAGQFAATWAPGQTTSLNGDIHAQDLLLTRHHGSAESGSVAWQKVAASVRKDAAGLFLSAGIYEAQSKLVDLDLHLGADRSEPISGTFTVDGLNLAVLAPLAPGFSVLEGELNGRLRLAGSIVQPLAEGSIKLSDGYLVLVDNPTVLQQLDLQFDARGDEGVVQGRGMLGGGQLAVTGTLLRRPRWSMELAIGGERHEILLPPYTQMLVSEQLNLTLTGELLDLKGDIVVHEGLLQHQELPQGGVILSDDVVEVDLAGTAVDTRSSLDIRMNIGLLIEDNFKILADMVNATVGGDLQLTQAPRKPLQVFGNLNVIGGELRAYQQRLRIQRGTVTFAGTPENPDLDVRAQREIPSADVVVGLQLQGSLKQARLGVFSNPAMSDGEAMSYLVRGRGLDSGAGADGVAMALSLGTGLVNRSALMTELNRIPGISNIAFGSEGSNESDTAATVGGYIGERLYLSYGLGIYEPINVLTARLYLQTRLWLEVVSRLENSVDLYYSFDIE